MVTAIALSAFAFAALAALLGGTLQALSVSKARTQGNEIATQGIEDLQRLSYDNLGLCDAPDPAAVTPPAGLSDTVFLTNCASTTPKFEPCGGAVTAGAVAAESYSCRRIGIDFSVRRYVAYGDIGHTQKRLAVLVNWRDRVGLHEVSQQSSLRIPSQSAIVGAPPPTFSNVIVNPPNIALDGAGRNNVAFTVSATTAGLTTPSSSGDTVVAGFSSLEGGGQPTEETRSMLSSDGVTWTLPIAVGEYRFGNGNQLLVLTAIRKSDGKVGGYVHAPTPGTGPIRFGNPSTLLSSANVPAQIHVTASGDLVSDFTVSVSSTNVSPNDTVYFVMETLTGAVAVAMRPGAYAGGACTLLSCTTTWSATVDHTAGYHLKTATAKGFYFRTSQVVAGGTVDSGQTDALVTTADVVTP